MKDPNIDKLINEIQADLYEAQRMDTPFHTQYTLIDIRNKIKAISKMVAAASGIRIKGQAVILHHDPINED